MGRTLRIYNSAEDEIRQIYEFAFKDPFDIHMANKWLL